MGSPISRETFLERALARFGDHYDYTTIVYKSYKTPIGIRCRLHPVKLISITPEKHLQTTGGCKFCLRQNRIRMLERELQREAVDRPLTFDHGLTSPATPAEATLLARPGTVLGAALGRKRASQG
jgi:hypothetical protein